MRSFRLARIAAEAELLRLRRIAQRTATRVVLALVAAVFLLGTLACLHIAAWFWLRISAHIAAPYAALILAGADLVLALLLLMFAARSSPSRAELEALEVRKRAIQNIGGTMAWMTLALQLLRTLARLRSRRR